MRRLFFAVAISADVAARLRDVQRELANHEEAAALRFSLPEQAHYTLKFLGPQDADRCDAATRAAADVASRASPFELGVEGRGVFPDEGRAHTLWLGAGRGGADLSALARSLEGSLAGVGFPRENRPYIPHVTLARIHHRLSSVGARSLLALLGHPLGTMQVDEFALFESRSGARGVEYVSLATFRLTGATRLP